MNQKILVPDIGDFEAVEVIEILVKSGDFIKVNTYLIQLSIQHQKISKLSKNHIKNYKMNSQVVNMHALEMNFVCGKEKNQVIM